MCGIAGIVHFEGGRVERSELERMAATLVHRGPDDIGIYVSPDGAAGFGFRRLSIIDLASGHQPMSNENSDVWVVFNGEIYNHRALRAELETRGHHFATRSDTETLVHAWEEWRAASVERLRGMFGYAIWDERERTLFLARDRAGEKPLYYYCDGRRIAFASELKALVCVSWVPRELDLAALGQYLSFGYIPAPRSILRGVHKLGPAHRLIADATAQRVERYWEVERTAPEPLPSVSEAVDEFDRLLNEAVAMRLEADVPLGAFLSGGIDSSVIVAMMARH